MQTLSCIYVDGTPAMYKTYQNEQQWSEDIWFWLVACYENNWEFSLQQPKNIYYLYSKKV